MSRRPLPLAAGLIATTVVVSGVLGWLVWRLIDQQHAIDEQRARDQLERSADAVSARIGERFAAAGEQLAMWTSGERVATGLPDAVVVTITPEGSSVAPAASLPFVPFIRVRPPGLPAAFAVAESLEVRAGEQDRALTMVFSRGWGQGLKTPGPTPKETAP